MKEKTVKEIELKNGQTLVISDASRMISEDAYVVIMKAKMEISVEKTLFSDGEQKEFFFEDIIDKVGKIAVWEHVAERNFIMVKDKDKLFAKLLNDFSETLIQYISKQEFPKKLILKKYKDNVDNKVNKIKVV